jgi:molecular chaperone HtpG
MFDSDRKGRIRLYVKRVFITDDVDVLPRYLRFVRGIVDSADLPLNISREMLQDSPILAAIKKGVTSRVLNELERLTEKEPEAYTKIWENFGSVLKEGLYEDTARRDELLGLTRFKTTASDDGWRSLKDYTASLKENQTAIYYLAGEDLARLKMSPHLEGFRARGVEVLLLSDPIDTFWVTMAPSYDGKPFKSASQGAADLAQIARTDAKDETPAETDPATTDFLAFVKTTLGDAVTEVRASDRLTDSPVCLVAPETGIDRGLERLLSGAGRLKTAVVPVLEVNPRHELITALARLGDEEKSLKGDAAHLLFDEARVLDGERPVDPRAFAERLGRVLGRLARKD